jgi:hypothetical protein
MTTAALLRVFDHRLAIRIDLMMRPNAPASVCLSVPRLRRACAYLTARLSRPA